MTKWHLEWFKINGKKIDGLFNTTLDNILMGNYQCIKYKYDEYVKEYNKLLEELTIAKKNIEKYFINGVKDIEAKNKLIKEYLEIKKNVKDYARDIKYNKIYYRLANRCYDIAKNKTGELFTKDLVDKELKDLKYIKF